MSTKTIKYTRLKRFLYSQMKQLSVVILVNMFTQIQQTYTQNLILHDTTITSPVTFSANSITAGPNFTIESTGDVIFSANTTAIIPQFFIIKGGKLQVVSGFTQVRIATEELIIPDRFILQQNYPNPFNPTTVISWQLAVGSQVELSIFNILGKKVTTLVSERQKAGFHQAEWDASRFSSGVYYYQLLAGEFREVRKMILLR